jgi:hypothetical protein
MRNKFYDAQRVFKILKKKWKEISGYPKAYNY